MSAHSNWCVASGVPGTHPVERLAVSARVNLHQGRHVDLGAGAAPLALVAHPERVPDREDALGDPKDDRVEQESAGLRFVVSSELDSIALLLRRKQRTDLVA